MTSRLEASVERIMGSAFEEAWVLVRREVFKMMNRNPKRFKLYVHAVGWGPSFFGPDGKAVEEGDMNRKERKIFDYLVEFYDRYGGNNERVEI